MAKAGTATELGTERIGKLLMQYAIPAIIAMTASSLYNMVDSIFIGHDNIYDIAGIRVVCSYIKDVYLIRDRLMAQDDVMIMQIKDYIETPKENGYRSLHMVIRVPVYFMNKKQLVPVELQIRTLAMDLWASLEHDIKYKCLYQAETEDFSEELKECSRLIYEAEEKMEIMNRTLEA